MDILQDSKDSSKRNFIGHVFSSSEEDKAEFLNVIQYGIYALVPVVILNKLIQRFIPEADPDKSSLELLLEIFIQIVVIFCGIIVIHRTITYFPTYSGFKYENLMLTSVILAFLVIVLSIQSKLGTKANILVDRVLELWNGKDSSDDRKQNVRNGVRVSKPISGHTSSQADYLDNGMQDGMFPPAPVASQRGGGSSDNYNYMMKGSSDNYDAPLGPIAANSLLGSSFGAF